VRFEWDEAKNNINIRKHGIDFNDVTEMFTHPMLNMLDTRAQYGEERWIGLGLMSATVALVVYTERQGDVIRIISARKATKHEAKRYEQAIKN
jgi:uncharacterized DUF497 family protein